jgi:acyl-CoA reductase-like NAD-dependent aldehyde dehydrogenase
MIAKIANAAIVGPGLQQVAQLGPIMRYADVNDLIPRANNTSFGLGNSVWSKSLEKAGAVAKHLDSGSVWITKHGDIGPDTHFAGAKMSGVRIEMRQYGPLKFTQAKVINYAKVATIW